MPRTTIDFHFNEADNKLKPKLVIGGKPYYHKGNSAGERAFITQDAYSGVKEMLPSEAGYDRAEFEGSEPFRVQLQFTLAL